MNTYIRLAYKRLAYKLVITCAVFVTLAILAVSVLANPLSVSATDATGTIELSTQIDTAISMSITGNADSETFCPNNAVSCSTFGGILPNSYASTSSTVRVYTNSPEGYSLSVRSTNSNTNMSTTSGDTIAAGVLTGETGGQGVWSYKTDNTGAITNWAAMGTGDTVIKGTSAQSENVTGNATVVTYGLSTSDDQTSGRYTTSLTYTATAPNESSVYPTLAVNLRAGIAGAQVREGSITGAIKGLVTTSGGTVRIDPAKKYYIVPMYNSGYTLDTITADATKGSVASDANAYGYYYYQSNGSAVNIVTLSGTPLTTATTDNTLPAMQTLASSSCPSIPTAVQDSRDNSVYYVQKLIDGNCWMLENLRLTSGTLTSSDSNVVTNFTLPASAADSNWVNAATTPLINTDYNLSTVTGFGAGRNYVGVYYNYAAASVGTIVSTGTDDDIYNVCPANWTLPSGGASGQFQVLSEMLTGVNGSISGNNALVVRNVLSLLLAGFMNSDGAHSRYNEHGHFWSTSRSGNSLIYNPYINGTRAVHPQNDNSRGLGVSVRCIHQ